MKKTTGSFTQDWDIAITFDDKKINDLLAECFQSVHVDHHHDHSHKLVTDVEVSIDVNDRLGERYTQWYHFTLGSPCVQFESTPDGPSCSLRVNITKGKVWAAFEDGKIVKEELEPNAYTISVYNINLGAVTGTEQEWNDANIPKASGGNDVVVFPDYVGYASHVVFDLGNSSQLSVDVACTSDVRAPCAWKRDPLLTALRDFFVREINPIHYTLAVVNNARPSESITDLVPKSFRFTTMRASNTKSYLTLFIQTRSSDGRNDNQPLQSLWIADWTKAGVPPIPKHSSTSIIVNDAFFATSFINPALARYDVTTTVEKTSDEEGGIRLRGMWPKMTRPEVPWQTHVRLIALEETKRFRVHSMAYDPNVGGSPLRITLAQSVRRSLVRDLVVDNNVFAQNGTDKHATVAVEWSYSFNNPWNGSISRTERDPPVVGVPVRNVLELNGTFTATYNVSVRKDLVVPNDGSFHVDVKKSDWTVEVSKAKSGGVRDILLPVPSELIDQKKLLEFAKDAAIDTIDIGVDFAKLTQTHVLCRYLLVMLWYFANVDAVVGKKIEINVQSGVRVPRDVVVVSMDDVAPSSET